MKSKIRRIMKTYLTSSNLTKGALLIVALTLSGCASRSVVPQPPINIPEQYAYKMGNMLDATGFQNGAIDYNAIPKYNKVILNVKMSDQLVEPGSFDGLKTGYLVYSDQDVVNSILPYAQDSFRSAFLSYPSFQIVSNPGPDTLKIDVYITEIVINDAVLGTLGNIPSPTWILTKPIGMGLQYISNKGGGAIAVEIVITDSQTNQVIALFADREMGVFALLNTERFSMYTSIRRIINTWSEDLVSTLDQVKAGSRYPNASRIAPLIEWVY